MRVRRPAYAAAALLALAGLTLLAADEQRSIWDGVYTADQAKRGAELYGSQCSSCHGPDLSGGEMAPALSGGEFLSNWNGLTLSDLFDRIKTTMPANNPGNLSRPQTADLIAHILSANQVPAGNTD